MIRPRDTILFQGDSITNSFRMPQESNDVFQLGADFSAALVPLQAAFDMAAQQAAPEHWADDGIHATVAGFAPIAREWLATVEGIRT